MPTRNIFTIIALLVGFAIVGAAYQTKIEKVPPKAVPARPRQSYVYGVLRRLSRHGR